MGARSNEVGKQEDINALLHLLDDSDAEVYQHVYQKLRSYGNDVLPILEYVWGANDNPLLNERIEELISTIQSENLKREFSEWADADAPGEMEAAYLLSRVGYSGLSRNEFRESIERLRRDIWLEMTYHLSPLEQVSIVNQKLFGNFALLCNHREKSEKEFYISHVLETKTGNNFSVSLLYMTIASQLDLPVYGLDLPGHFAMVFCKSHLIDFKDIDELKNQVMFYINPANKGSTFTRSEIKEYLVKMKMQSDPKYFVPCSLQKTVLRYMEAMRQTAGEKSSALNTQLLDELIELLKPKAD